MDRIISQEVKKKRRQKSIVRIGVILFCVAVIFYLFVNVFQAKVNLKDLDLGRVDRGTVEVSIYASGKIIPLAEEIVTSPVSSKVLKVYKKAGDIVKKGEPLLQLDIETLKTEYETKIESLEMQANKLELKRKTIANELADMEMQIDIDQMTLKQNFESLSNERYLDSIGASTKAMVREAELNYKVKQMHLEQLKRKYENRKSTAESEVKSLQLDYKIAKRSIDLLSKTLGEAHVMAPQSATLTWINNQVGSSVASGSNLAILSDLSKFKIEAELADSYADKVNAGNPISFNIGDTKFKGTVGNVTPSVENGIIRFTVFLEDASNKMLRSGLKVDVHVIHAITDECIRIPNGIYYIGRGEYNLWVKRDNEIRKQKVILGEGGFEYVEVLSGLKEGDEVVVSDMSRFAKKEVLSIK